MRRNRNTLIIVIALIIAFIGLGIAYAAFSTTLTINGSATVNSSSWKIVYTATSTGSAPAAAGVSLEPYSITGTATGEGTLTPSNFTWSGTFTTPGDKLLYKFYIRNLGNYDAKITSINTPTISCTKGGATETTVCGKIGYDLYKNASGTTKVEVGDTLAAGETMTVRLIIKLNDTFAANGSDLPTANVTVNPSTISIVWGQA